MTVRLRPLLAFARSVQPSNFHPERVVRTLLPTTTSCLSSRSSDCFVSGATPAPSITILRHLSSGNDEAATPNIPGTSDIQTSNEDVSQRQSEESTETFASMLRNSTFMQMGNPKGKVVVGRVYHVVDDDLYIDFGFKFPCICKKPARSRYTYRRGSKVRILIKDLEMSEKFLGFERPTTIMEANCVLLGPQDSSSSMTSSMNRTGGGGGRRQNRTAE